MEASKSSQFFFLAAFLLTLTVYVSISHADNNGIGQAKSEPNLLNKTVSAASAMAQSTKEVASDGLFRLKRNNVATDPNNIRFILGKTQLFPIPNFDNPNENEPLTRDSFDSSASSDVSEQAEVPDLAADVGNNGGTHQSNINIGGIQNFGGNLNAEIVKLVADKGNIGGSHQSNVAIGGILNFK